MIGKKLDREVALKTLRPELLDDAERIARFEREARSLATLQHANVASIYGWEATPEGRFLVMELVEGENLAQRLARGSLPVDEAVAITLQICEGLGAAHDKRLVHRDLKPANIMLTPDGQVKILDFGLARAWAGDGDEADATNSPTITAAMTRAGTILGTAAYMSPEQARGRSADRRTDIWAVGVVLWEMLTGRQLFAGETVTDTLAAVLTRDLDLDAVPATTPATVRRGLARCLVRDPKQRLHDVNDLRLELLASDEHPAPDVPAAGGGRRTWRGALVAAALVVMAAAIGLVAGQRSVDMPSPPVVRMTMSGAGSNGWSVSAISPDGQTVAWAPINVSATSSIHVRRLDGFEQRILAGTEDGANPAFSPDGRWLAYTSDESGRDGVYVVSWPDASDRQQISVDGGHDPGWSRDGARLYFLEDQQVRAVAVTPGADLAPGLPTVAFAGNVDGSNYNHAYDVMPGGQRAVWIGRPGLDVGPCGVRVRVSSAIAGGHRPHRHSEGFSSWLTL